MKNYISVWPLKTLMILFSWIDQYKIKLFFLVATKTASLWWVCDSCSISWFFKKSFLNVWAVRVLYAFRVVESATYRRLPSSEKSTATIYFIFSLIILAALKLFINKSFRSNCFDMICFTTQERLFLINLIFY